jgi:nitrate reductase NapD
MALNISSVIVHARPGTADVLRTRLMAVDGVEIHAISDAGKFIVTIETDGDGATAGTFDLISKMDDVLSAALVYHQTESDPEMDISVEANLQVRP